MKRSPDALMAEKPNPDIVGDGGSWWLPPRGQVKRHLFSVNSFPQLPQMPLVARHETLLSGKDLGSYCNEDYYALYLVRSGRGLLVSGGHPYGLARGDVYITPPHTVYSLRNLQDVELESCYFQSRLFTRAELAALHAMKGFWKLFLPSGSNGAAKRRSRFRDQRLHLSPEQYLEFESMIQSIRQEIRQPEALGALMARHHFFCLLGTLARWHSSSKAERAPQKSSKAANALHADEFHAAPLADLIRFCDENFCREISVPRLAARAFLSPDHFAKLFAGETGVPPATYIRRLRLQHAQTLLRASPLTVAEIARQCGFNHHDVLTRAFRSAFGVTPVQYRKSFREKS